MIVSILTRHTRITERAVWEAALGTVLPKIREVLEAAPGFVSVQYLWGTDESGHVAQITTWQSEDDWRRYVRGGGAAMVATIEDAAVPTAAYPNGSWIRQTFSAVES
jgi:heme-degrading monooxygenase HmoA